MQLNDRSAENSRIGNYEKAFDLSSTNGTGVYHINNLNFDLDEMYKPISYNDFLLMNPQITQISSLSQNQLSFQHGFNKRRVSSKIMHK